MKRCFQFRLITILIAALVTPALMHGQFAKKERRGSAIATSSGDSGEFVSRGDNPIIKFSVAHFAPGFGDHYCYGYLHFSRDSIRYEVVGPADKKSHSFEFQRSELVSANPWRSIAGSTELKFRNGNYHFHLIRKSALEQAGGGRLNDRSVYNNSMGGAQELVQAANNFDNAVATLEARETRQHPAAPVASPPAISMLEPNGAESGKTVDVARAGLHLRGIASHASGITAVLVNGQAAFLKTLAPQTVEFDVQNIPVNPGLSAVVVLATATDKSQGQLIFTANRAEVRVLDPASNSQTSEPSVKVRGLALGFHDVERVEISGVGAVLRRKDSGETEFEADRVPLTLGSNTLQGFVTARNGVRENFQVVVKRLPPAGPPPLTLQEVQEALQGGVPPARVSSLVTKFGVDFTLTDESEKALRAAGADSNLLVVVAKSKK